MFTLIAEDRDAQRRWEHPLQARRDYVLGRSAEADLPVPWDRHVSRRHVALRVDGEGIEAEVLPGATNLLYVDGHAARSCSLRGGERFVVGETTFLLVAETVAMTPDVPGVEETMFDRRQLAQVRFRDADRRIDVLSHLPEVIWGVRTNEELDLRLVALILAGVAHADAVAVVDLDEHDHARIRHWDRRRETAGAFRPSSRLVADALGRHQRTILHTWEEAGQHARANVAYTESSGLDWAFCTPVADGPERWGLYVAGRTTAAALLETDRAGTWLRPDVKFTELVAEIIRSAQRLRRLERQQAGLRQFFAPPILDTLGNDLDTDLLEPRECDVTVLFCDLRGFSQKAEEAAGDLLGLLDRVSRALGVMTCHILQHGGVTGDFQGDAALGFWGWPLASEDSTLDACRAALGIRQAFAETVGQRDHPLADFRVGVGIAHGRAVAGKIGTAEHVKVTVFGPVVNLANRLEGMTKQLRVPILLDEVTAEAVRSRMDRAEGRVRRLAKVLPSGMETPLVVSELLPPVTDMPELSDAILHEYEQGVEHFIAGRWDDAYRGLHAMPASDRAQDFLNVLIAQHNRSAPPGWDGIVRLTTK